MLLLEPAQSQAFIAISRIPWSLKPLYGMASDFVPILGFHRIPYVCIGGALSTISFNILANMNLDVHVAVILLFLAQTAVATPGENIYSHDCLRGLFSPPN